MNWEEVDFDNIPDDVKHDIISLADNKILVEQKLEIFFDDFILVDPKKIHDSVYLPKAYISVDNYDSGIVWFVDISEQNAKKWLYYIGAENEAEIMWYDGENLIYHGISESRLSRYIK